MKTVYKYSIDNLGRTTQMLPIGAKFVHVGPNPANAAYTAVWAEIETNNSLMPYEIASFWTGEEIPKGFTHIGSCLVGDWEMRHVYVKEPS